MPAPVKQRVLLQHVWKTGGTEFCYLARANGWKTPPSANCDFHVDFGWPVEDYDMVANERPIFDGKVRTDFTNVTGTGEDMEVHDVKWATILRHPYSRTFSHYFHMLSLNQSKDFTITEFLTHHAPPRYFNFWHYVPNQQTRWHCGTTWECSDPKLRPDHLVKAMANLEQIHAVLILEDMKDPDSCTRLQMRHVLNLTKVEVLADLNKTNSSKIINQYLYRRPLTNWYKEVAPNYGPLVIENDKSTWDEARTQIMAAIGLHNDMDLQLYGYGRKLCEERGLAIKEMLRQQQTTSSQTTSQSRHLADFNSFAGMPFIPAPSLATLMQISLLAVLLLWMMMWPYVRRIRIILHKRRLLSRQQ